GNRDEEAQFQSCIRKIFGSSETMDEARESTLPHPFSEDLDGIVLCIPGMHDERQLQIPSRRDMHPEVRLLRLPRAVFVVVVEPCLADADDLGMLCPFYERSRIGQQFDQGFVRMDAD